MLGRVLAGRHHDRLDLSVAQLLALLALVLGVQGGEHLLTAEPVQPVLGATQAGTPEGQEYFHLFQFSSVFKVVFTEEH